MSKRCMKKSNTKDGKIKKGAITLKATYKYIKQAYLRCATRTTKCWWPQSYKTNYEREQVDFFKWSRHKYYVGSIGNTTFQVLTSFDNVEKSNNKGEENFKGLDISQHMPLQQKIHGITSLPHSNMGRKNESTKIPSYPHPSPLHPNVVLILETFKVPKTIIWKL